MAVPTPTIAVALRLSNQWSGTFDGEISLTWNGPRPIRQWRVTLRSRYALRQVSSFTMEQSQQADGSWLITLSPARWGSTLSPGRASRSYLQGVLPGGSRLASLRATEVLIGAGGDTGGSGSPSDSPLGTAGGGTATNPGGSGSSSPGSGTGTQPPGTEATPGSGSSPPPAGGSAAGTTPPGETDRHWGSQVFAPYVDMGLYPVPDLDGLARQHGVGRFILAFIQATSSGEAAWAGLQALSLTSSHPQALAIRREIQELRAAGGDVMVSFGGASGTSLAVSAARAGRSAADLADRYLQVIDALALSRIDLDIEGAALANRAANQLLGEALRLVQQSRPSTAVWFTLPVLPQGLTSDGLAVVRQALQAGVRLAGVNIMAMDYGDSAAPPTQRTMGQYAIDAATASQRQLSELFAGFGQAFTWGQLGITPMIGVNDVRSEVFSTADAQLVEDFARSRGLGMLAMWSIARDNPGTAGQLANTHSGTAAASGSYSALWADFSGDPLVSASPIGGPAAATGSMPPPITTIAVAAGSTAISASAGSAECFQIGYDWGRRLTITGFDPLQDRLDLRSLWAEGQGAQVISTTSGSAVLIEANNQQLLLPGVAASALTPSVLQLWQG